MTGRSVLGTAVTNPSAVGSELPRPLAALSRLPRRVDAWIELRPRLAWLLTGLLFALVAVVVVVPAATGPGGVSPLDEFWYADALDKADRGELSNTGDKVDGYARQVMSCRGVIGVTPPSGACGAPQLDAALPLSGYTAADIHPPTYFFATAIASKVVRAVGLTDDLLIAGRLVGVMWLALGMLAVVALGRAWGAGWVMPALTAVGLGTSPLLVSVSGYLSPDALGLLVGAGVLLAVTHWMRGRVPTAMLLPVAMLPASVKVPFVLAPLFGAALLVVAAVTGQIAWRRASIGAALLVGGAGAGAVLWQLVRKALEVAVPVLHPAAEQPVAISSFASYLGYYLETVPASSGAPIPVSSVLAVSVLPLAWLLLATALGGMLLRRSHDPLVPVCWAGTAGMVMGSMVLSVIVLIATGGFLIGTPRYGLALVPLFAVPLMCTRHPVAVLTLAASTGASVLSHALLW
jgi:hypothetical protein